MQEPHNYHNYFSGVTYMTAGVGKLHAVLLRFSAAYGNATRSNRTSERMLRERLRLRLGTSAATLAAIGWGYN